MQHLETTLRAITTANGYATDIGTVTRGMLSPLETSVLPTASLLPVNDLPEYMPQALQRTLTVTVRVWVDVTQDVAAALEALIADVQEVMQVDTRRGLTAINTREGPVQYLYLQSTESLAGCDVSFEIDYKTALTTPRQLA